MVVVDPLQAGDNLRRARETVGSVEDLHRHELDAGSDADRRDGPLRSDDAGDVRAVAVIVDGGAGAGLRHAAVRTAAGRSVRAEAALIDDAAGEIGMRGI